MKLPITARLSADLKARMNRDGVNSLVGTMSSDVRQDGTSILKKTAFSGHLGIGGSLPSASFSRSISTDVDVGVTLGGALHSLPSKLQRHFPKQDKVKATPFDVPSNSSRPANHLDHTSRSLFTEVQIA